MNKFKGQFGHVEKCNEGYVTLYFINTNTVLKYLNKLMSYNLSSFSVDVKNGRTKINIPSKILLLKLSIFK